MMSVMLQKRNKELSKDSVCTTDRAGEDPRFLTSNNKVYKNKQSQQCIQELNKLIAYFVSAMDKA